MKIKKITAALFFALSLFSFDAMAQSKTATVGQIAPEFELPTPNNIEILGPEDYKGKYLLVDFWASWCPPCRKAIPHLKDLYTEYNGKNFDILGVSVDRDSKAWLKALTQEDMPWKQVHVSGDDMQKISAAYQFNSIPHLVLIGPDGKIIARGVGHEEVKEILKEKLD